MKDSGDGVILGGRGPPKRKEEGPLENNGGKKEEEAKSSFSCRQVEFADRFKVHGRKSPREMFSHGEFVAN